MASNNKHEYDEHFHWLIALWDLCAVYIYPPLRFRHLHFFSLHFEIIVALKPSKTNGVLLWLVRSWETFLLLCPWPNLRSTSCFETNLKELQSKCLARHFMICLLYIIAVSTESINTDLQEFFFLSFWEEGNIYLVRLLKRQELEKKARIIELLSISADVIMLYVIWHFTQVGMIRNDGPYRFITSQNPSY